MFDREFIIDCATADYRLDRHTFDSHIAGTLDPLREEYNEYGFTPGIARFIIDTSKVRECDNYGCLALVLLCEQLHRAFSLSKIILKLPRDCNFIYDFIGGGFYGLIENIVKIDRDLPFQQIIPTVNNKGFLVTKIACQDDIASLNMLSDLVLDKSVEFIGIKDIARQWRLIFDKIFTFITIGVELAQNILEHSQSGKTVKSYGFLSFMYSLDFIEIAVMDLGIGIPSSLKKSNSPEGSAEAIKLACQQNVSAINEQGRGLGLYLTKEKVTKMKGEMRIRSGKATVAFNQFNDYYGERDHSIKTHFFKGTQIQLRLPVYTLMEDKDHGIEVYDF